MCGSVIFLNTDKYQGTDPHCLFKHTEVNQCLWREAIIWSSCLDSKILLLYKFYCWVCICILMKLNFPQTHLDPWRKLFRTPEYTPFFVSGLIKRRTWEHTTTSWVVIVHAFLTCTITHLRQGRCVRHSFITSHFVGSVKKVMLNQSHTTICPHVVAWSCWNNIGADHSNGNGLTLSNRLMV